jgi:phosphatidylglycerol:prolipoprotein diacylglycerol transferase
MYPNLYFFLKEAMGIEPWGFTQYINTFGLLVAIAFVVAAVILSKELKRREQSGLLSPMEETIVVGKPASKSELLFNLVFGFIVGYKILGVFLNDSQVNPQDYIFSSKGSLVGGLILGGLFSWLKYHEKKKQALAKPEERKVKVYPHERVGDITVYAAITGFIGAKVFDNLENWDRFIQDPIGNLLSPSGLTFYGGLILAYAIGRMGCHFSGDGDWGIFNTAYKVSETNSIELATPADFDKSLLEYPEYTRQLVAEYGSIDNIPHASFEGSSFLPNWFWAYNFPHNVNGVGIPMKDCVGNYCAQLSPPVFPTTLYEIIATTLLFILLWSLRKRIVAPGRMFGLYLMLNGIERFLIEKIRVNSTYNLLGMHPTQAELISVMLFLFGAWLWVDSGRKFTLNTK